MSAIPPSRSVNILGHKYRVAVEEMSTDELGRCDTVLQKISLRSDLLPDAAKDTLLHEILHAIAFHIGVDDPANEEAWVSKTATGLRTVLCDHSDLSEWIFSR
tara:strand:- start:1612 stop:1920 length:309 start_codon:yes stop_codon:yes gene_type:complete